MQHVSFIHSSVDGHLGCLCVLAIIDSAAVNTGVRVFSNAVFYRGMPGSGIATSRGPLFLVCFLRNLHAVLHSGGADLHPTNGVRRSPFSTSSPRLLFADFLMMGILTGVGWHLIVVLIRISLIINGDEHLFMCLVAICMSFFEQYLFRSSAQFLIRLFGFIFCCY